MNRLKESTHQVLSRFRERIRFMVAAEKVLQDTAIRMNLIYEEDGVQLLARSLCRRGAENTGGLYIKMLDCNSKII